jgi:RNA polymerase sigma-70 factor (ECF subfamily)
MSTPAPSPVSDTSHLPLLSFPKVVDSVKSGDPEGLADLYKLFRILSNSLRNKVDFYEYDDIMHDMFLTAVDAIQSGQLREPAALSSFIHGIAHKMLCAKINRRNRMTKNNEFYRHWLFTHKEVASPEEVYTREEQIAIVRGLISKLDSHYMRECIGRFYLEDQTKEQICHDLNLTETQFRLAKSRAKSKLQEMARQEGLCCAS